MLGERVPPSLYMTPAIRLSAGLGGEAISAGCGMLSTVQWSDSLADVCTLVTLIGTRGGPAQEGAPKGQKVEGIQIGNTKKVLDSFYNSFQNIMRLRAVLDNKEHT